MGYYCTVPQCTSLAGKTKNVKFHRFPRDESMADKWNQILKRGKPYTKYSKVCSLHFTQTDYNVTTMGQWKTLNKDAVPSQNLPKLNPDGTVMIIRKSRTIKYKESKKEDTPSEKTDKWSHSTMTHIPNTEMLPVTETQDLAYRLQTFSAIASTMPHNLPVKPRKQDAFMQTDPQSEEEENQPNNSYSETSERSFSSEMPEYPYQKQEKFEPKDFTKPTEDYIPQTNEEYNKEAEKYALGRKSLNGYDKIYQKPQENGYPKLQEYFDKDYQRDFYQSSFADSVELLRSQQQNIQLLQDQQRTADQNFFNESHIKQEVDLKDDKYIYDRAKDQLEAHAMYAGERRDLDQRLLEQLQHQVKQEPDVNAGCETTLQPQGSPYYGSAHNVAAGFYDQLSRPGPELLIAKQNALAAHTQLWQNMKRPIFYNESPYSSSQLVHRYEDSTRIQ